MLQNLKFCLLVRVFYIFFSALSSEKPTVPPPILEKPSFEVDERRKSCCACSDASQDPDNKRKENEVQSQIDFEDALQNYLYVKR